MLDLFRAFYPRLVLDGIEGIVDGESQQGEVLLCSLGSERIQIENQERLLLEGRLPIVLIAVIGRGFTLRVYLLLVVVALEGIVD